MGEPITSDTRYSFFSAETPRHKSVLVVFDLPTSCALCTSCLVNRKTGRCFSGGPYTAEGIVVSKAKEGITS